MTEIIKAAKVLYAHEFIMNTPDGYDTRIGTGGHGLSEEKGKEFLLLGPC